MKTGIYIHIPFCKSRCIYCGFFSTTGHESVQSRYVDAVLKEMRMRHDSPATPAANGHHDINTIYLGGGTPSALNHSNIRRLIEGAHDIYGGTPCETTMEVNPDDVTEELVKTACECGVNRISMGIQTFSDSRLRFLRRRHTARQAINAIKIIRDNGISNVSIDLMFGFPGETIADWHSDLQTAIGINPQHISAYSLMYEEGTALYHMQQNGRIRQIDDEVSLGMYNMLVDTLTANGYEHYEISNFAKPGFRSVHNSSYWHDIPYLGFGAAAHSYNLSTRSWNVSNLNEYITEIEAGRLPSESEEIDAVTHYNDLVTTAMRTSDGLDIELIPAELREYAINAAHENLEAGLLEITDNHIRLTRNGIFVSDAVMSDMIKV